MDEKITSRRINELIHTHELMMENPSKYTYVYLFKRDVLEAVKILDGIFPKDNISEIVGEFIKDNLDYSPIYDMILSYDRRSNQYDKSSLKYIKELI